MAARASGVKLGSAFSIALMAVCVVGSMVILLCSCLRLTSFDGSVFASFHGSCNWGLQGIFKTQKSPLCIDKTGLLGTAGDGGGRVELWFYPIFRAALLYRTVEVLILALESVTGFPVVRLDYGIALFNRSKNIHL